MLIDGTSADFIINEINENNMEHVKDLLKNYINEFSEDEFRNNDKVYDLLNSNDFRNLILLAGVLGLQTH